MNRWGWKLTVSLVLYALLAATCFTAANAQTSQGTPDHINVLLFYQKGCCGSCSDVENYVRDAQNKYYGSEMSPA